MSAATADSVTQTLPPWGVTFTKGRFPVVCGCLPDIIIIIFLSLHEGTRAAVLSRRTCDTFCVYFMPCFQYGFCFSWEDSGFQVSFDNFLKRVGGFSRQVFWLVTAGRKNKHETKVGTLLRTTSTPWKFVLTLSECGTHLHTCQQVNMVPARICAKAVIKVSGHFSLFVPERLLIWRTHYRIKHKTDRVPISVKLAPSFVGDHLNHLDGGPSGLTTSHVGNSISTQGATDVIQKSGICYSKKRSPELLWCKQVNWNVHIYLYFYSPPRLHSCISVYVDTLHSLWSVRICPWCFVLQLYSSFACFIWNVSYKRCLWQKESSPKEWKHLTKQRDHNDQGQLTLSKLQSGLHCHMHIFSSALMFLECLCREITQHFT